MDHQLTPIARQTGSDRLSHVTFGQMDAYGLQYEFVGRLMNRFEALVQSNTPFLIVLPLNGAALLALDIISTAADGLKQRLKDNMRFISNTQLQLTDIPEGIKIFFVDEIVDQAVTLQGLLATPGLTASQLEVHTMTKKESTAAILSKLGITDVHIGATFPNVRGEEQWMIGGGLDQRFYPVEFDSAMIAILERLCTSFFGRPLENTIQKWSEYLDLLRNHIRQEYSEAVLALEQYGPNGLPDTIQGRIVGLLYNMEKAKGHEARAQYMSQCLDLVTVVSQEA